MIITLNDTPGKEGLYPFTLTRSVADIRVGILTIREKWQHVAKTVHTTSEQITHAEKEIMINANIIPSYKYLKSVDIKKNQLQKNEFKTLEHPWQIFQFNDFAIKEDYKLLTKKRRSKKISSSNKIIGKDIFIEEGASVDHSVLNASTGPIYIGRNAIVMEGCMIRGPFALCEGSVLKMGSKVYGATTIGPYCVAGGEIKNAVMFGYSNKAHDGYLGDSVIGEWCNLGAGTSNSNIKNTAGEVKIWNGFKGQFISAGLKCGLLMGDYSRAAINTSFNTGTVVGVSSNVICNGFTQPFIDNFSWGNDNYTLQKALEHINNWKKLKGHSLSQQEINTLTEIYNQKKHA